MAGFFASPGLGAALQFGGQFLGGLFGQDNSAAKSQQYQAELQAQTARQQMATEDDMQSKQLAQQANVTRIGTEQQNSASMMRALESLISGTSSALRR